MLILYKKHSIRVLTYGLKQKKGRSRGRITVKHRGGGFKKNLRLLDSKKVIWNTPALVLRTEYNPLSNNWVVLLSYTNGYICYSQSSENLNPGDIIISGRNIPIKTGNSLFLKDIPIGIKVNNVESKPNRGAVYSKSAGNYCILLKKKK